MILFYVLRFFKKGKTIQGWDIIQGGTLFKEVRYAYKVRNLSLICHLVQCSEKTFIAYHQRHTINLLT